MELTIDFAGKKTVAGIIGLICIIGLVLYLPGLISTTNPDECIIDGMCQHEQRVDLLTQLIPVAILGGIIIGAAVFFFMTSRLESKQKEVENVASILLQFLSQDEKKVVQKILEGEGKVFQSEVSRIEGIGKLKSHRILQRLSDRRVIEIEKHGKTNIVKFSKEVKEGLIRQ